MSEEKNVKSVPTVEMTCIKKVTRKDTGKTIERKTVKNMTLEQAQSILSNPKASSAWKLTDAGYKQNAKGEIVKK